jgi:toxin YoeB
MELNFTIGGWEDFEYWIDNDSDKSDKIRLLLKSIKQDPFKGLGKPEPLKYDLKGYWSRRISGEDRLVYKVSGTKGIDQKCTILQCRFYYDDK